MAARTIFHTTPRRRQVLGNEMSYGPDLSIPGETAGSWLPPDATINNNGTATIPAKYVVKSNLQPGDKVNPDGSLVVDLSTGDPVKTGGGGGGSVVPPGPAPAPSAPAKTEVKQAGSSYLIPLVLLGATALGGYMLLSKRGKR